MGYGMKVIIKANGKTMLGIFQSTTAAMLWAMDNFSGSISVRPA
jgi:hypothetical protein